MTEIDQYLDALRRGLPFRGRSRSRVIAECREHLLDASAAYGPQEALRRFGPAVDLARQFATEAAARRGVRATAVSLIAVVGIGYSTLALLNAADPKTSTVPIWAITFFAAAQTAGVSAVLAGLRAMAMRHGESSLADVALLCRRNGTALICGLLTLLAAAGAVPGHASAWRLLIGPAVAVLAGTFVLRARALTRKLDPTGDRVIRPPLADLNAMRRRPAGASNLLGAVSSGGLLAVLLPTAAAATYAWDQLDHGTVATSITAAAIEPTLILIAFVVLGPVLGLRGRHRTGVA